MEYSASSPIVKAIVAAILANPQRAVALAAVDQVKVPYTTPSQLLLSIVRAIGYNIRGTNDLLARSGGQSPFGNLGLSYTRLGVPDPFLNAGVGRFAAQAGGIAYLNSYYQTRGSLAIMLTGRRPSRNGYSKTHPVLLDFNPTLASVLKDAGYSTSAIVDNPNVAAQNGYAKGFDSYRETWEEAELASEADR